MNLMVFDVGGTDIKYCVMDESLDRKASGSVPTPLDTQEHFFQVIREIFEKTKEEIGEKLEGMAMSLPGFIDTEKGRHNGGGYLMYNYGTSIGPELSELLGVPVILGNDGKCAAMAELEAGSLKGCKNASVYIIGTGVGGGLIINGEIVNGSHFTAGEYSFMGTDFKHFEDFGNALGMQGSTSGLLKFYKEKVGMDKDAPFNGKDFFEKANAGEKEALEVLDAYAGNVAKAIFNINALLDLEKVAIGGGISRQPILLTFIQSNLEKIYKIHPAMEMLPRPEVVNCQYLSDANMVGAYMLYKKYHAS